MVQPAEHVVYAIHDYEIPGKGFLPLKAGDVIYVVDADASGWWLGINLRRQRGVFPSTYTLPYVFPAPPADLLRDVQLLLLAREFQVDLVSGAPVALRELKATPHSPSHVLASADFLRDELQRLLLEREAARKTVMDRLTQLLGSQERRRVQQRQAVEAQRAYEQQCDSNDEKMREARGELQDVIGSIGERREVLLLKGKVPPAAWYHALADVVDAALPDSNADAVPPREAVWRAALKDVKAVVRQQEKLLAALSSRCAEAEAAFTEAAAALQTRVEWRDTNVAAMLAYWADVAAQTKLTYISRKTERDAAEAAHQQEAAQLRRRLEEGKRCFSEAKETYRKLKREAQTVSDALRQQETLNALSREIAHADSEIAVRQQRA
ncbi:hypothetical protein ABB37_07441 [Leptomonas pyrrhocoris]|uniref:SH3 domain-containing protein n=1 Tax=Leptomonas pyrrhocoris TaxID=157538 RepID=A0A0N1J4I5_LEPPY|nr:hypothetical protein ABB37_07441 [Leptomonas pyrrhocoris]KPA77132.1 hypothetical protein ABB37_07441 [Leptomonas pyrrhocoris]|eukprot:XP_015655571.1 hypothetical protein ABB37_07441 [Leptomonas pyrrhocoris]